MAFPILAVLAAAASDIQSRQDEQAALQQSGNANVQKILRTRAQELGGSPYPMMSADNESDIFNIQRQSEAGRNNNIGNLLQAYLGKNIGSSAPAEKMGDDYAESFYDQPNLQYNAVEDGIGMGDAMGKAQHDPWDKDPWGDAGF